MEVALVASHQWVLRKSTLPQRTCSATAGMSFPIQIPQLRYVCVVFCFVVVFLTCLSVPFGVCVCHPYFSWLSIFLVISLISPPLSPPNGALCCGTSHLFLCALLLRVTEILLHMSQMCRRWSNLYLFTSWITIYFFVRHCMAPHTVLCALLLHITEILLWVCYIVYIQIYIEILHGNHILLHVTIWCFMRHG